MSVELTSNVAADDDSGINLALLAALPAARHVLELGCATGRLAQRYKRGNPAARWTGVDVNAGALAAARGHIDEAVLLDLDVDPVERAGTGFDLIVCGDVLEHLKQPERLLERLRDVCAPDARLVCCLPNMSHISVIERLIRGDIMYDAGGLLDATHLRFISPRSAAKMFLDAGWLPNAAGGYQGGHANAAFSAAILDAAQALGLPPKSAQLDVFSYQLVVSCRLRSAVPVRPISTKVSVVVAADDPSRLALNLMRSPGLAEIDAEIVMYRGAASAAAAFAAGVAQATGEWILLCHADVYFPRGTGFELLETLERVKPEEEPETLIGFAGVGLDASHHPVRAGLALEGRVLHDFPNSKRAASIADFAVLMHRRSVLRIDPTLRHDLWATDLCLAALGRDGSRKAAIVRIPVLHNSVDDGSPSTAFAASAQVLAAKYPQVAAIPTLRAEIRGGALYVPTFAP